MGNKTEKDTQLNILINILKIILLIITLKLTQDIKIIYLIGFVVNVVLGQLKLKSPKLKDITNEAKDALNDKEISLVINLAFLIVSLTSWLSIIISTLKLVFKKK